MIVDGEKYACEACVRGHRVSNCQHSDRPLQHINKKGRPVSQCAHCRSMRKSRAAHIKCDCGEKTSKCTHLQPTVEGHTETCCCNHGGRCTCALKKEPSLDTVPESDSEQESTDMHAIALAAARPKPPFRPRRRANTIHADGGLSFDENGHHKPMAKHNRAAQKCNPYQLNRVNSTNSASSLGAGVEGLSFTHNPNTPKGVVGRERRVKSETASPLMSASSFQFGPANLPPLDLSRIDNAAYVNNSSFDLFGSGFDQDGPMYSAGLSAASVDWSHYEFTDGRAENFAPSSYSQTGSRSFNGLFEFGTGSEQLPNLANTTSTSGDVSEVEDCMPGGDDMDSFGGNGFLRHNVMTAGAADLTSIDYDSFYKNAETAAMAGSGVSLVEEDPAFWMPNYNDGIATVDDSPDPLGAATANNFWQM
ncbi:Copper fist DNA binding domain protein [Cordyceps militaris CM01]|uniref:Copper fist DNA binding domain protein n=1 Tax=Cordyceps militaris (strain CM01) TaxID=983644 RepID=G3JF35_CORMM|nr:Copper fist DNA binding domain protein [Cordyceps militaris CM01]EGX93091.1 Copper fist DNA binding domain protein [Cordyceps militaris CM01]